MTGSESAVPPLILDHLPESNGTRKAEDDVRRHKLLFLARPFPPLRSTACVRTWNIAKYLARLGWDITVVTPHPSLWRNIQHLEETAIAVKREGIKCILTDHQWRFLSPEGLKCWNRGFGWLAGGLCRRAARRFGIDKSIGWLNAVQRACSTLTPRDVDVILATGSPFTAFGLARSISDRLECPYVLDYRDPWTGNPHASDPSPPAVFREETQLLGGCAAVTIVSPSWASAMARQFGIGSKLHVLTNGYDPEEFTDVRAHNFGHFAIVYAGRFYPPKRVISPVMAALEGLKKSGCGEWYFHYYGADEHHVREEAIRFNLSERIILHGNVSRSEVLSAVRGAGVAVVIASVTEDIRPEDKGIIPGKVFETLGLSAPILLIAPPASDISGILESTGLKGSYTGRDIEGIQSFLADAMYGSAPTPTNPTIYAWPHIIKKMDHILLTTIGLSPPEERHH